MKKAQYLSPIRCLRKKMRAGQLSIFTQQTAIELNFLRSAFKSLNCLPEGKEKKRRNIVDYAPKPLQKNRDLVQNEQKKSKPPATALQHQSLCQAVATHEAAICQSIWVESDTVLFAGIAVQASTNCFKMSVNLRQAFHDFHWNFQKCYNSQQLPRTLSCTNRRCHRGLLFLFLRPTKG